MSITLYQEAQRSVSALPGVEGAATGMMVPLAR